MILSFYIISKSAFKVIMGIECVVSCSQRQVKYCLCCLHSGNDRAQMVRLGNWPI